MLKVFFIGAVFLVSACGVSEGIKGAKGSKRQEGYEGHDNSDISGSKVRLIHKDDTKKKTRKRQGFYYLINNDECKFSLVNNSGSILLKIPVKEGEIYKRINFPSSRVAFVQENNKFYVVLANERINRGVKAKNYEGTRCDFLDLYRQKSEEVTIRELTEGVWAKIREKLLEYNATLNTYSSEDGLTVYTFRSNPTKEHKDKQKKFDKNYQNKSKANKNITLENDEYAKLFKILPKTFFITINGLYNNEDLKKCLQYMKEEIVLDEYLLTLLDKKIKKEICRAEILVKICRYLNCDSSFVSSICVKNGYKELEKAFEELINVEFLKIIKNLLDKKDKDDNEILNINNLSSICNGRGFSDFEKLVDYLYITENLDKIEELKNNGIVFQNLSSICRFKGFSDFENLVEMLSKPANLEEINKLSEHGIAFHNLSSICCGRGFSDFEKLVEWLNESENLKIISELKNNGIVFQNLSCICGGRGFNEFKELVEWLSRPSNLKIISALKEEDIVFVNLSSQCAIKGLQGLKNHLVESYRVEIKEEENDEDSKESKKYNYKYNSEDTKPSKKERLREKKLNKLEAKNDSRLSNRVLLKPGNTGYLKEESEGNLEFRKKSSEDFFSYESDNKVWEEFVKSNFTISSDLKNFIEANRKASSCPKNILSLLRTSKGNPIFVSVKTEDLGDLGSGLFADEDIGEGQIVGIYTGTVTETKNLDSNQMKYSWFVGEFKESEVSVFQDRDLFEDNPHLLYVNSSKSSECNLEAQTLSIDGFQIIAYVTNRQIQKGEQFFIDYGEDYWKDLTHTKLSMRKVERLIGLDLHLENLKIFDREKFKYTNRDLQKSSSVDPDSIDLYASVFKNLRLKSTKKVLDVVAGHDIKPGEKVLQFTGHKISISECKKKVGFWWPLSERMGVCANEAGNISAYIAKKSEGYNLEARVEDGKIFYYATRKIEKGDSLFVNSNMRK